ncbi:MAG TPA: 4'-phosphopantetheinyl transferase superfamily protein [Desulfobacteraceae bacterium]|nr:4'-phosphopantetheinyl transferase superfamily protein [Desulfobacteraceae bacterium]
MTRQCLAADNRPFSLSSFFTRADTLLPGLPVRYYCYDAPSPFCLALIDLAVLAAKLQNGAERQILLGLLSEREKALFATYTYSKRQGEWLGGRLACKYATLSLHGRVSAPEAAGFAAISILPAKTGRPELIHHGDHEPGPCISISHSSGYAVAMAARAPQCGIDIQKISKKIIQVQSRFAAAGELDCLRRGAQGLGETERLTLLWSAKEALKKALLHDQPAVFHGLSLHSLHRDHFFSLRLNYPGGGAPPARITAAQLDHFMLAFYPGQEHHA